MNEAETVEAVLTQARDAEASAEEYLADCRLEGRADNGFRQLAVAIPPVCAALNDKPRNPV